MRTCCFCFDLKSGTTACAVFTLVINIKLLVGSIICLVLVHQAALQQRNERNEDRVFVETETSTISLPHSFEEPVTSSQDAIFGSIAAVSALTVLFSVLLLIGVKQGNRALFLPWVALMGLKLGGILVLLCLVMASLGKAGSLYVLLSALGLLITGIFYSYQIWCVSAYYNAVFTRMSYHHFVIVRQQHEERNPQSVEKDTKQLV